ncbi:hypothetical protein [Hyphomicrobium sp. DY-1]|uniref:hypothetical protein n=1 Tax=Hyphomicrobium sp. DY-1 TaxID=3075650 RepID=UPI0039C40B80
MASRSEPLDSLDFFPTPPWSTRALCEVVLGGTGALQNLSCWEPAAGEGHMSDVLAEYFRDVFASDIWDYGRGHGIGAFAAENSGLVDDLARCPFRPDWIISNPPFNLAKDFVIRGLEEASTGVAMLLRTSWLEGRDRYETIFRDRPPTTVAVFAERVPMVKGRWDPKASTATSYVWFIWEREHFGTPSRIVWIPPGQREALTRSDDVARFAVRGIPE